MRTQKTLQRPLKEQEAGFVSIVIALTIVIVLALITVAFAQLTRHEQQNALDKQLASQANYAAETGINDAIDQIARGDTTDIKTITGKTTCPSTNGVINSTSDVSYSCLLVNMQPPDLFYGNVGASSDKTVVFSTTSPLSRLSFSWGSASGNANFAGNLNNANGDPDFTDLTTWAGTGHPPVVEVMFVPFGGGLGTDRAGLRSQARTVYLYPASAAAGGVSSVVYASANGAILSGACAAAVTPNPCKASLTGIPLNAGKYMIHFKVFYDALNLDVTGFDSASGSVNFIGGQAIIDSTGRARDVLKRLQVHVPLNTNVSNFVNYGIESQNVCKQFTADPTGIAGAPSCS